MERTAARRCTPRVRSRGRIIAITVAALALIATACGDDDTAAESSASSSTTEVTASGDFAAQAERDVNAARQPIDDLALPSENAGDPPPDRHIVIVKNLNAPLPNRAAEGAKQAAEAIGWSADILDGGGNPQGWLDAVNRAITSDADAIITVALPTALIQPAIDRAADSGIPVFGLLADMDVRSDPTPPGLVNAMASPQYEEGYRLGQWVALDAPAGAEIIVLNQPEIRNLQRVADGFKQAIEDAGGDYEIVAEADAPLSDLQGPQGPQRIAALLRDHPDARYIFTLSEGWFPVFQQAAQTAGREDVTALGSDGDLAVPLIQEGARLVMIGPDSLTYGWYAVDSLIRAFNDRPQPTYEIAYQLVDSSNAGDIDSEAITATADYRQAWAALWAE